MAKEKFDLASFEGDDVSAPRGLTAHLLGSVRGFGKRSFQTEGADERVWLVAVVDTESGPVEISCDAPFVDRATYGQRLDVTVDITSAKNGGDVRCRYIGHRPLGAGGVSTAIVAGIEANNGREAVKP